jgi:hypothetical protein
MPTREIDRLLVIDEIHLSTLYNALANSAFQVNIHISSIFLISNNRTAEDPYEMCRQNTNGRV